MQVEFVPHLVPMNRGILSTIYLRLKPGVDETAVRDVYRAKYGDEPFVALWNLVLIQTLGMRGTNRCHIGLLLRTTDWWSKVPSIIWVRGQRVKLRCFNLMAGIDETSGLKGTASFPMCAANLLLFFTLLASDIMLFGIVGQYVDTFGSRLDVGAVYLGWQFSRSLSDSARRRRGALKIDAGQ